MNSSHSHLVISQLGDEGQSTGETPGTQHENGPLLSTR
jgi:hypothetical protein